MNSTVHEVSKCYEILRDQALEKNDKSVATWAKYKTDLDVTKSLLELLPKKVNHDVMVPIGPRAFMPGKIVHTNEFLVNLGETWFAKRTAHQTIEICNRRIETCDEMIGKLNKERELIINKTVVPAEHEAFGNEERPEIIEYVTEEENEEWKKEHRIKEKEYRKQLAELRNKEKKTIETEEDLWKHLDELELQEELEDELNRLHSDYCSDEETTEEMHSADESVNNEPVDNIAKENETKPVTKVKRKVSFACDLELYDEEPLVLEIKHSETEPAPRDANRTEILSPSDIYDQFLNNLNKKPLSVLKSDRNPNKEKEMKFLENVTQSDSSEDEEGKENSSLITTDLKFNDVIERQTFFNTNTASVEDKSKKVSKFKASRIKK